MNITHEVFIKGYKTGKYFVYINKNKAGDFVLSDLADKHNKPAHYFWTWSGILLMTIGPIILLFVNWIYSIASFILGMIITNSARNSAAQFVIQNMLDDSIFWEYVISWKGAKVTNKEGEEITFI